MRPLSVISLATSPTRLMFSTRSASVKPRLRLEPMADIVAVQQHRVTRHGEQLLVDEIGDGGFSGAGQAGKPEYAWPLVLERGALILADEHRLPGDIGGSPQRECDHPRADGSVGVAVDNDEGARPLVGLIRIEHDR